MNEALDDDGDDVVRWEEEEEEKEEDGSMRGQWCRCMHHSKIRGGVGWRNWLWVVAQWPLHVWRSLDSELSQGLASSEEERFLRHTRYREMASLVVWRKSNMLVLLPLNTAIGAAGDRLAYVANGAQGYLTIASMFALFWSVRALYVWDNLQSSQYAIRWAWACLYCSPFLLSFIPWNMFVDPKVSVLWNIGGPTSQELFIPARTLAGAYFSLRLIGELLPRTLALSVSIVRGALNVRSLQTQSSLPGYLCMFLLVSVAPLMWLTLTPAIQLSGSFLVLFGGFLCCFAPVIFWLTRNLILTPMTSQDAHRYSFKIRIVYLVCLAAGLIMLIVFLASVSIGNEFLQSLFTLPSLARGVVGFLSEYFLTNVFVCDILVSMYAQDAEHARNMDEDLKRLNEERRESIRRLFFSIDE